MGKNSARLFPKKVNSLEICGNIVELEVFESRRQLRQKVYELIRLATLTAASTEEIQRNLALRRTEYGDQLSLQLLRSLIRSDPQEHHAIVLLLILLNDPLTIAELRRISKDKNFSRSIRLSAALALAGMGETEKTKKNYLCDHLHAMGNL
ncbi:MAG: hypothetical protein ACXWPG_00530 [Ktedonobacteraceae bacterium]